MLNRVQYLTFLQLKGSVHKCLQKKIMVGSAVALVIIFNQDYSSWTCVTFRKPDMRNDKITCSIRKTFQYND